MHRSAFQFALAALTVGLICSGWSGQLLAADKASTDEMPAALKALGADPHRVLSQREASEIRGESIGPIFLSAVVDIRNRFTGSTRTEIAVGLRSLEQGFFLRGSIIGQGRVNVSVDR